MCSTCAVLVIFFLVFFFLCFINFMHLILQFELGHYQEGCIVKTLRAQTGIKHGFFQSMNFEESERHRVLERNLGNMLFFKYKVEDMVVRT